MNAASVGFQCPECVREGSKSVRSARTAFGGALDGEQGTVTRILVGLNVGVFGLMVLIGLAQAGIAGGMRVLTGGGPFVVYEWFAMLPLAQTMVNGEITYIGVADGELWRLVTAGFLHAGILHLLLNMWALLIFGREVERLVGRWRYLTLYLLSGVGGAVAAYVLADEMVRFTVGASGSVFGLFGAMLIFIRRLKLDPRQLLILIALNVGITIWGRAFISWEGHLGGFVVGALVGLVLAYAPRGPNRTAIQIAGMVIVAVALAGLVVMGNMRFVV